MISLRWQYRPNNIKAEIKEIFFNISLSLWFLGLFFVSLPYLILNEIQVFLIDPIKFSLSNKYDALLLQWEKIMAKEARERKAQRKS